MHRSASFGAKLLVALALPLLPAGRAAASGVEYVIITADDLVPGFQPLADWKIQQGVTAEIRTIAWIDANYPEGVDGAERVRLFIRDAYANLGTIWVLLGGDSDVVPVRYASTRFYGGLPILTDYYFMCLDGTWNADGDQWFGEIEDDVDLNPEVFAGRAPVSTAAEARAFVEKTILYDSLPPAGATYPAAALFMAERLFPNQHGASIAEEAIAQLPPQFEVVRLYEEPESWPGALPLDHGHAVEAINAGFGLVYHIGRSTEETWGLGEDELTIPDVEGLTNAPFLSVVTRIVGSHMKFDPGDAIGEHWLTNPGGGAVALLSQTSLAFVDASRNFEQEWYRLVFEDGLRSLGLAAALARFPFIEEAQSEGAARNTVFAVNLLGDPALRLRVEPGAADLAEEAAAPAPAAALLGASPNPFARVTRIAFDVPAPAGGGAQPVRLAIYDANGRLVHELAAAPLASGRHIVDWDGRSAGGLDLGAGTYFLRYEAGGLASARKLTRVR